MIKRFLILAMMLISLGATVNAQEGLDLDLEKITDEPTFEKTRFGIVGAVSMGYSNLTHTDYPNPTLKNRYGDPTFGGKIGGMFEYQFTKNFAAETRLMYVYSGYQNDHTNDYTDDASQESSLTNSADFKTNFHSLEMPLLFTYKANFKKWRPYAQMGPYINVAFAVESQRKYSDTGDVWVDARTDATDPNSTGAELGIRAWQYNKDNWGMKFGFGAEWKNYRLGAGFDLGSTNYTNLTKQVDKVRYATIDFAYFF